MKPPCRVAALACISSLMVIGCAGPGPQVAPVISATTTTASWKAGEYSVVFRAGPGSWEKSFSSYEVSRKFEEDTYSSSIAVESPLLTSSLEAGSGSNPGENIKLFTSSSGKTLLITEDIPNDCAPCQNWILIRGADGKLVYDYLEAPMRSMSPDDIMGQFPQIIRVTENEITYRYPDGKKETAQVKDIVKKEKRPTFPG